MLFSILGIFSGTDHDHIVCVSNIDNSSLVGIIKSFINDLMVNLKAD